MKFHFSILVMQVSICMTIVAFNVQANYLQFNVTPRSSDVRILNSAGFAIKNDNQAVFQQRIPGYIQLRNLVKTDYQLENILTAEKINIILPTPKQMQNSASLPVVYGPGSDFDTGQYVLSLPGYSAYPIAITAKHGYPVFNLANLVLKKTLVAAVTDFNFVFSWWDVKHPAEKMSIRLAKMQNTQDNLKHFKIVPWCEFTLPVKEAFELLAQSRSQTHLLALSKQYKCSN